MFKTKGLFVFGLLVACLLVEVANAHHRKPTPPPCKCPRVPHRPAPVCGSNGQSYRNVEILECVNCKNPQNKEITVVHKGNCKRRGGY